MSTFLISHASYSKNKVNHTIRVRYSWNKLKRTWTWAHAWIWVLNVRPHFAEVKKTYPYLIHVYYRFHICQIVDNYWRVPVQMTLFPTLTLIGVSCRIIASFVVASAHHIHRKCINTFLNAAIATATAVLYSHFPLLSSPFSVLRAHYKYEVNEIYVCADCVGPKSTDKSEMGKRNLHLCK